MKIKITQPGWEKFTGDLGMTQFVDGVSVDHIARSEAYALGAYVSVVEVDEHGNEGNPVSHAWDLVRDKTVSADIVTPLPRQSEIDAVAAKAEEEKAEALADAGIKTYTQVELEDIASKKGIAGLREIADPLGVKGVAVKTLIAEILVHQKSA